MRKKSIGLALSAMMLSFTMLPTVPVEASKNVTGVIPVEDVAIGKDYENPNLKGAWIYNKEDNTFSWSLNWQKNPYAKTYKIYRKAAEGEYEFLAEVEKKDVNSYTDSSMEPGKQYTYKLHYIHGNREIAFEQEIEVDYELDTDGDQFPDVLEHIKGTGVSTEDSDGDGLIDGYEAIVTGTDYLLQDTDSDGTSDLKEDMDNDGLENGAEFKLGTNPKVTDTDADGLLDGEEVAKATNPVRSDSDGDGLEDGFELENQFNPLKQDTDDNGIKDGDEQIQVTTVLEEAGEMVKPSVTITSKASEASTTSIVNFAGEYAVLDESLPGILSAPYEFNTDVEFDTAKMQFSYDNSLNGEKFKPAIFYFNEETQMLEKVANQTIDPISGKVTADVEHFSIYLLLNEAAWEEAWAKEMKTEIIGDNGETQYIDVVLSIDSSGSMDWNDPGELRKEAAKSFVDKLRELDQAAVVDFDDSARTLVSLTTDHAEVKYQIDTIDDVGGTNLYAGLLKAVQEVSKGSAEHKRFVIFLTDGDGTWNESALRAAKSNNVTVYTIGLGSSLNEALLKRIATETGGKYFHATDANELKDIHDQVADETVIAPDFDKDGLPDVTEEFGFRTETGAWLKTDPKNSDTDGDGLSDGDEAGELRPGVPGTIISPYYFTVSNPLKKDTDDDGLLDLVKENCEAISYVSYCKDINLKKYDISGFTGSLLSEIAYVNFQSISGNQPNIAELTGNTETALTSRLNHNSADRDLDDSLQSWQAAKTHFKGWKIIAAEDSAGWDTGLGAVALKKGNDIVIAYRGSEGAGDGTGIDEIAKDWLSADVGLLVFGNNIQVPAARDFAYNVILSNPDANVHVVGHSLGGFLAQAISYDIIEEKIDKAAFWLTDEWKMQKILDNNPNIFARGMTYNAAPFSTIATAASLLFASVPLLDVISSKYDDDIYNFGIKGDILSESVYFRVADRVGRDVPMLPSKNSNSPIDAHSLEQFYRHFQ